MGSLARLSHAFEGLRNVIRPQPFTLLWPTEYPVITQPFGSNPAYYSKFGLPASGNVLVHEDTRAIDLIDVEDMYGARFARPSAIPHGTDGYNHREARAHGQWQANGDRFSGAILICEVLGWYDPHLRTAANEDGTFFEANDMQQDGPRVTLLRQAIGTHPGFSAAYRGTLLRLFETAWNSSRLDECPTLETWSQALQHAPQLPPGTPLSSMQLAWPDPVRGWRSIPMPSAAPNSPATGFRPVGVGSDMNSLLAAPRLVPNNGSSTSSEIMIRWLPVPGAKAYELEESSVDDFSSSRSIFSGAGLAWGPEKRLAGSYYYRVRAVCDAVISEWSKPIQVRIWR